MPCTKANQTELLAQHRFRMALSELLTYHFCIGWDTLSISSFMKLLLWHVSHLAGGSMLGLVKSCIGTKFTSQFGDLIAVSNLIGVYFIFGGNLFPQFTTSWLPS